MKNLIVKINSQSFLKIKIHLTVKPLLLTYKHVLF